MNNLLKALKNENNYEMYQRQGISYLGVFGSVVRGEDKKESDIDILIDFDETKSFFELADIQYYLEEVLDKKVDLVPRKSIKPQIKSFIEKDLVTVYEKV